MKLTHLLIAAMAIAMTACAGGSGKDSKSDSAVADTSVATASIVAAEKESAEVFSAPDLTFAEVKGNVKKVTETFDGNEYTLYEFDENGVYKTGSRLEHVRNISRDDQGRIIGGDNDYFKVEWENGQVKKTVINESDGTLLTNIFTYDENGNLVKKVSESEGPDGDYSTTYDYNYDSESFDEHGNWVKRNVHSSDSSMKDYQETRKIYYY